MQGARMYTPHFETCRGDTRLRAAISQSHGAELTCQMLLTACVAFTEKCLDKHHRDHAMHRERINTTHLRPLLLRCLFPQISRVLRFTAHGPNSPGLRKSSGWAQIQAHAAEELEARARPSRQILPEEEAASA